MKKNKKEKNHNSGGFTLVEIMVVVIIIGILASIAGINIHDNIIKTRINTAKAEMKNIEGVLKLYFMDKGVYPNTLEEAKSYFDPYDITDPWGNSYTYKKTNDKFMLQCTKGGSGSPFSSGDQH